MVSKQWFWELTNEKKMVREEDSRKDIPLFDGEYPYCWTYAVDSIFQNNRTPEEDRLEMAVRCLVGVAYTWFISWEIRTPTTSWSALKAAVIDRFIPRQRKPTVEESMTEEEVVPSEETVTASQNRLDPSSEGKSTVEKNDEKFVEDFDRRNEEDERRFWMGTNHGDEEETNIQDSSTEESTDEKFAGASKQRRKEEEDDESRLDPLSSPTGAGDGMCPEVCWANEEKWIVGRDWAKERKGQNPGPCGLDQIEEEQEIGPDSVTLDWTTELKWKGPLPDGLGNFNGPGNNLIQHPSKHPIHDPTQNFLLNQHCPSLFSSPFFFSSLTDGSSQLSIGIHHTTRLPETIKKRRDELSSMTPTTTAKEEQCTRRFTFYCCYVKESGSRQRRQSPEFWPEELAMMNRGSINILTGRERLLKSMTKFPLHLFWFGICNKENVENLFSCSSWSGPYLGSSAVYDKVELQVYYPNHHLEDKIVLQEGSNDANKT